MNRIRSWLYFKLDDLTRWVDPYDHEPLNVGEGPSGTMFLTDSQLELFEENVKNHGYIFTKYDK